MTSGLNERLIPSLSPSYEVILRVLCFWDDFSQPYESKGITSTVGEAKNMRNTYRVSYRIGNGRIKTEDLMADSLFDSAASVCQSHHLKSSDIISNVIKDAEKGHTIVRKAFKNVR